MKYAATSPLCVHFSPLHLYVPVQFACLGEALPFCEAALMQHVTEEACTLCFLSLETLLLFFLAVLLSCT